MTTSELESLRPRAFAIAYRMLGSVSDAEDVVQEALLRVHRAEEGGEQLESPRAFVATVTTRLAIDELRSARARRETYVGEWLPEPVLTDQAAGVEDPARAAEVADSLSMAFLVVLESLTPEQRAVFLLRDVFDYPYGDVAGIVGKSENAVRQIAVRARRQVEERKPRFEASRAARNELAERFLAATRDGDVKQLEELLADDIVITGDGAGPGPADPRQQAGGTHAGRVGQGRG
jgi:RNA polymerase sigma factor (sigma-70 family)